MEFGFNRIQESIRTRGRLSNCDAANIDKASCPAAVLTLYRIFQNDLQEAVKYPHAISCMKIPEKSTQIRVIYTMLYLHAAAAGTNRRRLTRTAYNNHRLSRRAA